MRIFKVFLVLTIVAISMSSNLVSAEPQTKEGSKSIYFSLKGLDEIGFDNSTFGAQYIFKDKWAFWGEIGFLSETSKASETAQEQSLSKYNFSVGILNYVYQNGPVAAYYSPQLGIALGGNESGSNKVTTTDITMGISIGVEWWMFDNVSLAASTLFGYVSSVEKTEQGSFSSEATKSKFGILGSSNSKFLISFYF